MAGFSDIGSMTPTGPDPSSPATPPGQHRQTSLTVLAALARRPGYQLLFAVVAVAATGVYTLMLPGLHTMRVDPSNWVHLTAQDLVFSLALGIGLAAVLTLQVFALRQAAASRSAAGGKAALGVLESVAAVVPSLCCTPVLPTVLALVGVGAAGSASTMHAIAPHATLIWIGVLVLLALTGWWTAHRIAAARCDLDGCPSP
ncbi:Uncharacterised protein [Mycobacteroides abscessus subsp. massiliense]|nr:Uncharacterised protein [Mycobacteroides abscessus subsp. massiliense]